MELRGEDRMLACSGAGFAAGGLLMARYRMKASLIDSASTYGLAARAIGLGTLISVSSVGLLIGLTAKALDIHSMVDLRAAVRDFQADADHQEYTLTLQQVTPNPPADK